MDKILVKIPTRTRPHRFIQVLKEYVATEKDPENIQYLISVDEDDETMNDSGMSSIIAEIIGRERLIYLVDISKNKIDAINRDIKKVDDWDILVNGADDMVPIVKGWDEIIREKFNEMVPIDKPMCLHFSDGTQPKLCTMAIMNRAAYELNGWIYHPSYISLWCDQEYTDFWNQGHRMIRIQRILFEHRHPATRSHKRHPMDSLYKRNEDSCLWNKDMANYHERKSKNFPK